MTSSIKARDPYHYREFLTYQLNKKNPYYPIPLFYGAKITKNEALSSWEKTRGLIRAGKVPDSLFLYINIPFCNCRCYFCQSPSMLVGRDRRIIPLYLDHLYREMADFAPVFKGWEVTTVYFGGGTPSLLNCQEIEEAVAALRKNFLFTRRSRITFEASPATLDRKKLDTLKKLGVHELDLGIESFDDRLLSKNARPQKAAHTRDIIFYAKKIGIPLVSCDLMVGMPRQTTTSAIESLAMAAHLPIDGVYICPFIPRASTSFRQKNEAYPPEKIAERNRLKILADTFFQRSGYHNTFLGHRKKWGPQEQRYSYAGQETTSLLAFGHHACSRAIGAMRYTQSLDCLKDLERAFLAPELPKKTELAALHGRALERMAAPSRQGRSAFSYRGIRMDEKKEMHVYAFTNIYNLSLDEFKKRFRADFTKVFKKEIRVLAERQKARVHDGRFEFLNEDFVSNKVIRNFFIDKAYIKRVLAADKDTYDPAKDYKPLIAPLAV